MKLLDTTVKMFFLENSAKVGLPIPQKLKDILEQLNKEHISSDEQN